VIIVDTSVLVDYFRGKDTPATGMLDRIEGEGITFSIPGICCQELLQGARDQKEWKLLLDYLGTQNLLFPADPWETHVAAARIYYKCRRKGITIRSTVDCLIAALVIEHDGELLHDDEDYELIRRVHSLRTHLKFPRQTS